MNNKKNQTSLGDILWEILGVIVIVFFIIGLYMSFLETHKFETIIFTIIVVGFIIFMIYNSHKNSKRIKEEFQIKEEKLKSIHELNNEAERIARRVRYDISERYLKGFVETYHGVSGITAEQNTRYTNENFAKYTEEFLDLYYKLEKVILKGNSAIVDMFKKDELQTDTPVNLLGKSKSNDSMIRIVENHYKGFSGEKLVKNTLKKDILPFYESVNLKKDGFQVEVDFLIVVGNNVVTIEVKDYSADEIVLDASGEIYKVFGERKEPVEDLLSQVNRHRRFFKTYFPNNINVINLVVLSDKRTRVSDKLNSNKLKIVVPNFVVNVVDDLNDTDKTAEYEIKRLLEVYKAEPRTFEFFDVKEELEKLRNVAGEESLLEEFVGYYQSGEEKCIEKMIENMEYYKGYNEMFKESDPRLGCNSFHRDARGLNGGSN